jgi:hypothetical protein
MVEDTLMPIGASGDRSQRPPDVFECRLSRGFAWTSVKGRDMTFPNPDLGPFEGENAAGVVLALAVG